jgi:hypothetical protein
VRCIYTYEDSIMKPIEHCLKKQGEARGKKEYNGGVNLFKVHRMHVWNYHSELPMYD